MDKPSLRAEPPAELVHPQQWAVLLWKKQVGTTPGITASPVISADSNTLYIGTLAALSAPALPRRILTALDISIPCSGYPPPPSVKSTGSNIRDIIGRWTRPLPRSRRDPVRSHVQHGPGKAHAINPSGSTKWVFPHELREPRPVSVSRPAPSRSSRVMARFTWAWAKTSTRRTPLTGTQLWTYATTNYIQSFFFVLFFFLPLIGPVTGGKAHLYVPSRDHNLYAISSAALHLDVHNLLGGRCHRASPVNQPPTANAGADQGAGCPTAPLLQHTSVTLDGSGSSDPDGDPLPTRGTSATAAR